MKITRYTALLVLLTTAALTGCDYNNEDDPPVKLFRPDTIVSVQMIKDLYAGQLAITDYNLRYPVEITHGWAVRGVVTASDKVDGNLYKEAYVQDASGGIRLVFESTSGLYIGDSVIVNMKGLFIGDYGNFWQVGSIPYTDDSGNIRVSGMNMDKQVLKTSVNNHTFPDTITITQAKSTAYLGKLVTFKDVQFSDEAVNQTYADVVSDPPETMNRNLMDCTRKKIIVRTSGYASFAGDTIPDKSGTITGIITIFSGDYQFVIRDYSEVKLTNDRCMPGVPDLGPPVETISQNFNSFSNNADILVPGWQNISQYGDRTWQAKYFSGNTYAQATGYNSDLASMVTWLITSPVTITSQKILSFQTAKAYWEHSAGHKPLEVFYSTNYTGRNLLTATWVPVTAVMAQESDADHTFINSGNISLPVEAGKTCVIAFRYTGSDTESTSYRLDNIAVTTAK
ncbi:MAG TPA: DUF5689 domain-containing protein [Bacteroidales bacterium]|nr:DUF5689 domain-containing protein [Bacteroidales bacterium]